MSKSYYLELANYNLQTGQHAIKVEVTSPFHISAMSDAINFNIYNIVSTIENGSITGPNMMSDRGTTTLTIIPSSGYSIPSDITVIGADYTYDSSTGTIIMLSPYSEISIIATCIAQ